MEKRSWEDFEKCFSDVIAISFTSTRVWNMTEDKSTFYMNFISSIHYCFDEADFPLAFHRIKYTYTQDKPNGEFSIHEYKSQMAWVIPNPQDYLPETSDKKSGIWIERYLLWWSDFKSIILQAAEGLWNARPPQRF